MRERVNETFSIPKTLEMVVMAALLEAQACVVSQITTDWLVSGKWISRTDYLTRKHRNSIEQLLKEVLNTMQTNTTIHIYTHIYTNIHTFTHIYTHRHKYTHIYISYQQF